MSKTATLLTRPRCPACVEAEPKVRSLFDRVGLTLVVRDVKPEEDIHLPGLPAMYVPTGSPGMGEPGVLLVGSEIAEKLEERPDLLDRFKAD